MNKSPGIYDNILQTIGNTPLIRLNKVTQKADQGLKHEFLAKIEYFNPAGSVKDRIGLAMIEAAEKRGELKPGGTIVEATAGNTGLGLALAAAVKGYKCIFVLPEKMSEEKRAMLRAYGARVVMTPMGVEPDDPRSHYSVAKKIAQSLDNCFYANQFHNPDNFDVHYHVTGPEIWEQTGGNIDVFVAGVGTGGTLSGVAKFLKEKNPNIKVICADPYGSILADLFYHGKIVEPPGSWKVEGVGEDMLPENCHLKLYDDFVKVNDQDSFDLTRRLITEEGLCVGPSSALILKAAMTYAEKSLQKPSRIVVLMPDSGRAYMSKAFNDKWLVDNGLLSEEALQKAFNVEVKAADEMKRLNLL
ncbi:PLP-dependent cysteine synthase family protein [Pseudobdellovibrio exovorus]|uniref:Cystathionine beta-synthase n=1 Tax=Pseudobdellovibrio exovorus JSS TaxID=1184267 RepID=M4VDZ6_9BACT|nr:cysteine synthase family protein [Pseudobdellovibrio exovorus]AGH96715.1 cystathionine beta-synthase [Pseudobdellovibrio exovorus JSS]